MSLPSAVCREAKASCLDFEALINSQIPLSETPLVEPPIGKTTNFVDPPSLAPVVVAINTVLILWALFSVIIRLYVNVRASRPLGMEDCKAFFFRPYPSN